MEISKEEVNTIAKRIAIAMILIEDKIDSSMSNYEASKIIEDVTKDLTRHETIMVAMFAAQTGIV